MRVLTAAVIGTLFLALAAWVADQAQRVVATLPMSTYSVDIRGTPTGEPPAAGAHLTLLAEGSGTSPPPVIGSAIVEKYDRENRVIVVRRPEITNTNYDVGKTRLVRVDGSSGPVFTADVADNPRGRPPVEPVLMQGIAASLVLILGASLTYWMCAIRPKTVDFLINTDMEMKKVNWSTRKDIVGSTWVVIGSSVLIAAFIFATDAIMKNLFEIIGVLKT